MEKKLKLEDLKIESFITSLSSEEEKTQYVRGATWVWNCYGGGGTEFTDANCTAFGCCNPSNDYDCPPPEIPDTPYSNPQYCETYDARCTGTGDCCA